MKRRTGIALLAIVFLMTNVASIFANEVPEGQSVESGDSTTKTVISAKMTRGIGDTIVSTFPDANFAQGVADAVAGGNVNAVLTQSMVDNCKNLYINSRNIQSLEGIGILVNLENLGVSTNKIATLPEEIGNLTNLKYLDASFNQLTSLPEGIGGLASLEMLFVNDNQIASLPDSIDLLDNLLRVHAFNNQLTSLPEDIDGLDKLQDLLIWSNQIASLPNAIGSSHSLKNIQIGDNKLTSLPDSIGNLMSLESLYINQNQVASLPDSMGNLTNLTYLDANGNQLTSIPDGLGPMVNLEMNLQDNLLPTDYQIKLNSFGPVISYGYRAQRQLVLKTGVLPYTILTGNDLENIDLLSAVELNTGASASAGHIFALENYVDNGNATVDINEYVKNGVVQKDGTVYAQVRATGTGLFPNNSDHAITTDKIQLNFQATYYQLDFDLNGATGVAPAAQNLLEREEGVAVVDPTREGYVFTGWNTQADGTGTTWTPGNTQMPANNVKLYAQWKALDYVINYNLDGGINSSNNPSSYKFGVGVTNFENPTKDGYKFLGWFETANGNTKVTNISTTDKGDKTLYARWEKTATTLAPGTTSEYNKNGTSTGDTASLLGVGIMLLASAGYLAARKKAK